VTRPAKPAVVRFHVDADVLGPAKILVQVRSDVTHPGDPGGTLHHRVRESGARMISLAGSEAIGTWPQLEVLMCQWRAVERAMDQPRPFIYGATRTSLRAVPLR